MELCFCPFYLFYLFYLENPPPKKTQKKNYNSNMEVQIVRDETGESFTVGVEENDTNITFRKKVSTALGGDSAHDLQLRFLDAHTETYTEIDHSDSLLLDTGLTHGCELVATLTFDTVVQMLEADLVQWDELDCNIRFSFDVALAGVLKCRGTDVFEQLPIALQENAAIVLAMLTNQNMFVFQFDIIPEVLRVDPEMLAKIVGTQPELIRKISPPMIDEEIACAALTRWGGGLEYLPSEVITSRVVRTAVQKDGSALAHAKDFRGCKETVRLAAIQEGSSFTHATAELRGDRAFVIEVASEAPSVLAHAAPEIRNDVALFTEYFSDGHCSFLQWAGKDIKSNKELVLMATREDTQNFVFADSSLKQSKSFERQIAQNNRDYNHSLGKSVDVSGIGGDSPKTQKSIFRPLWTFVKGLTIKKRVGG